MSEKQASEATIERAHRLSRKDHPKKPRPVVVSFLNFKTKMDVLEHGRELKGTQFSMYKQVPRKIMERRCILYPIMKVPLIVDNLYQ